MRGCPERLLSKSLGHRTYGRLKNFTPQPATFSRGSSFRAPVGEIRQDVVEPAGSATLEEVERACRGERGLVVTRAATPPGMHWTTLNAVMWKPGISRKGL